MSERDEKRKKAQKLIAQALDDSVEEEEAASFAMKAVKIISKYKLLEGPLDGVLEGHPTVDAAKTIIGAITDPSVANAVNTLKNAFAGVASARRRRR